MDDWQWGDAKSVNLTAGMILLSASINRRNGKLVPGLHAHRALPYFCFQSQNPTSTSKFPRSRTTGPPCRFTKSRNSMTRSPPSTPSTPNTPTSSLTASSLSSQASHPFQRYLHALFRDRKSGSSKYSTLTAMASWTGTTSIL